MTCYGMSLFMKVVEKTIPKFIRTCTSKKTRQNLTRECGLRPKKKHLMMIAPYFVCLVDRTGAMNFFIHELMREHKCRRQTK
ncbi:hypothetical protein QL285_007582 [Trifolium repens]|nr:hypothetical protein QL285_007582 [Trifolium repens]